MKTASLLPILVLLLGCAPHASNISPSAISWARYDGWGCDKLAVEQQFVEESLTRASADQDSAANRDILMVFLIGVPTSGGGVKGEVARLKGEQIAIQRAMVQAGCFTNKSSSQATADGSAAIVPVSVSQRVGSGAKITSDTWNQCRIGGRLHGGNTRTCLQQHFAIDIPETVWESCRGNNGRVARDCVIAQGY